ncbi:hypothetical protein HK097_004099, partial [Rhizophlyctis rosea]
TNLLSLKTTLMDRQTRLDRQLAVYENAGEEYAGVVRAYRGVMESVRTLEWDLERLA